MDGREVALSTIEPGGMFGQATLLARRPVELTWVAPSLTTLAVMTQADALTLIEDPLMSLRLARDLAQQVCDSIGWQKILSVSPVSARVCSWLLWHFGNSNQGTFPTHAELAWRLNTTRESVTRTLQRLLADDVLRREGEFWHLANREGLRLLAQGEGKAA
jgi:CRP/FNR family transcriptional regulator, cyclic AMP receptor protein